MHLQRAVDVERVVGLTAQCAESCCWRGDEYGDDGDAEEVEDRERRSDRREVEEVIVWHDDSGCDMGDDGECMRGRRATEGYGVKQSIAARFQHVVRSYFRFSICSD